MTTEPSSQYLYVFFDEGGNFDFSGKGSGHFTLTALSAVRPFAWDRSLLSLKYHILERGLALEYFHASNDKQGLRDRVYAVLAEFLGHLRLDAVVVEKSKTSPELRPMAKFYPLMVGRLLRCVLAQTHIGDFEGAIVITDTIPVRRKRKAVEKAIKEAVVSVLPAGTSYRVFHHAAKSCFGLQVADYCNWAIFRKWESSDLRSYEIISQAIRSEVNIFPKGRSYY